MRRSLPTLHKLFAPEDEQFFANQADLRQGQQFDRVLFGGSVVAYSCLVGQHRLFKDGCEFFLSDHFPLMSFLDLHASHAAGVAAKAIARRGVLAVGRLRDIYAAQEAQNSKEKEQVGREEAVLGRAQAADRDRGEVHNTPVNGR